MRAAIPAVIALCMPHCGAAQQKVETELGSRIPIPKRARIPETPGATSIDKGRIAMAEFARCTVDLKQAYLTKILSLPADRMDTKIWRDLADDQCLFSGEMHFQPALMRGALFAELQRRRRAAMLHGKPLRLPVVPIDQAQSVDPRGPDATTTALLMFATCVIDRAPRKAQEVLDSAAASGAQNTAFSALGPELTPCLPEGQTIKLSKAILEGALGEALYRGHVAPVSATETK